MKALTSTPSKSTKTKKLVTTSMRPLKSFSKTKSVMPLKVKFSKLKTKVAK